MMVAVSRTAIVATGVGKADYSATVGSATEPIVSSYQADYHYQETISALAPGAIQTIDVTLTSGYVVLFYDWEISTDQNEIISIVVYEVLNGVATSVLAKGGYQKVTINLSKGFPFFGTIRLAIRNRSGILLDIDFHMHGINLPETQYYLSYHPGGTV